jgi:polyhydroxyalkanoate synthesis regulator phasin
MVDKARPNDAAPAAAPAPAVAEPRRPGHRGADMRDTVAELTERAQLISQEAGSKVAAAMKDVISAGAGIAGFAVESARDLVQFMVRRGQMTPEEADKLMREAEAAHAKRPDSEKARPTASKIAADKAAVAKAEAAARAAAAAAAYVPVRPMARPVVPATAVAKTAPVNTALGKAAPGKVAEKTAPKTGAKTAAKPTAKTAAAATAKTAAKPIAKTAAKPSVKSAGKSVKAPAKSGKPAAKKKR